MSLTNRHQFLVTIHVVAELSACETNTMAHGELSLQPVDNKCG